ncbi:hypothetical protein L1987_43515 [Smallanthus sonchifolius]|uniref:Uncharacterized protein n=1 Tax=Smallanthus sonchifolius TaxID=185202 RepID=A0ACB9GMJ2_9ASTR|nr:hypothetical protein L1987_43515 [Smallanthus sonchifolius]
MTRNGQCEDEQWLRRFGFGAEILVGDVGGGEERRRGCSTAMFPDRVVHALNLNIEAMDGESKLQSCCNGGSLVSDYGNFTPITMSAVREWPAFEGSKLSEVLFYSFSKFTVVAVNNLGKWKTATQMNSLTILLVIRDNRLILFHLCF